ncbi:hypothetical protein COLO4_17148 [Corchorus olitorius]|uniref:Uncharacterized protein n=1 Tax=Corchorus olitorius TaxID=93759 RepID=A0A1R3JE09_9ROSI|nr:hypothetical protein COLO4_17148 [Corchorus olitorius]
MGASARKSSRKPSVSLVHECRCFELLQHCIMLMKMEMGSSVRRNWKALLQYALGLGYTIKME